MVFRSILRIQISLSGTATQTGELPIRFTETGEVAIPGKKKETREFNGRNYVMEEAL